MTFKFTTTLIALVLIETCVAHCLAMIFFFFFSSDLFATVLRGPSAQARRKPSPGPHKGVRGSPQKSKAGKASLDARAAGRLAAASCARGGGWAKAHRRDDLRAGGR